MSIAESRHPAHELQAPGWVLDSFFGGATIEKADDLPNQSISIERTHLPKLVMFPRMGISAEKQASKDRTDLRKASLELSKAL
jgi:hypothetical protein